VLTTSRLIRRLRKRALAEHQGIVFFSPAMLPASIRICLLIGVLAVSACSTQDEARQQHGLPYDETSQIPEATPGPGIEKVKSVPDATPRPTPNTPMDRPLDPTGFPDR
jgi:hypothetical protein